MTPTTNQPRVRRRDAHRERARATPCRRRPAWRGSPAGTRSGRRRRAAVRAACRRRSSRPIATCRESARTPARHPMSTASRQRHGVLRAPFGPSRSAANISAAPISQGRGRDGRRPQRLLEEVVEEQADDDHGHGAGDDPLGQPGGLAGHAGGGREQRAGSPRTIARNLAPEERQDGGERADVQRDVEGQAEGGSARPSRRRRGRGSGEPSSRPAGTR